LCLLSSVYSSVYAIIILHTVINIITTCSFESLIPLNCFIAVSGFLCCITVALSEKHQKHICFKRNNLAVTENVLFECLFERNVENFAV